MDVTLPYPQAIKEHHTTETGFVLGGKFTLDQLRDSRFCLCPSGWGWGWRLSLAVITQCVPVIIQPNVSQVGELTAALQGRDGRRLGAVMTP